MHAYDDEPPSEVTPTASSSCEPASEQAPESSPVTTINIQLAETVERSCLWQHSRAKSPTTFHELISEHATPKAPRCITNRPTGRKRKVGHACVITASPYKKSLQEARERTIEKDRKKQERKDRAESKKLERAIKQKMKQDTAKGSSGKKRQASRNTTKRNKKTTRPVAPDNSLSNVCGNCGFTYGEADDPLIQDTWWQCMNCQRWCHESCGTTGQFGFVCAACE